MILFVVIHYATRLVKADSCCNLRIHRLNVQYSIYITDVPKENTCSKYFVVFLKETMCGCGKQCGRKNCSCKRCRSCTCKKKSKCKVRTYERCYVKRRCYSFSASKCGKNNNFNCFNKGSCGWNGWNGGCNSGCGGGCGGCNSGC